MRKFRNGVLGAFVLALALVMSACQTGGDAGTEDKGTIVVGVSATFTENIIVAEMYAQVLEAAGYTVDRKFEIGSREISQPALEGGEIHVKPEYLATLYVFFNPDAEDIEDPDVVAAALEEELADGGVELLEYSSAVDTNAIVVTGDTAAERDLEKVSDLTPIAGELIFGGPPECPSRPFCIPGLRDVYGIEFQEFKPLDVGSRLTVAALEGGEIDVALLFSTSGVIARKGFVLLEDDKNLQAADNIVPVVSTEAVNDEVRDLLNGISAALTTENITELNARVDVDGEEEADVARDFLEEQGLI